VPVHEWLLEKLGTRAIEPIENFLQNTDYLDADATRALIHSRSGGPWAWYVLNLAMWWERWIKR
jgi:hypothetical protein